MTAKPPIDRGDTPETTEDAWSEPSITINGIALTTAQAMTVRVALQIFALGLQDGLGDGEARKGITQGYRGAIRAIDSLAELETAARRLARVIGASIPPDTGFFLKLFKTGAASESTYVTNCKHADLVAFLSEFVEVLAGEKDRSPGVASRPRPTS
jgi:hypothetical protein